MTHTERAVIFDLDGVLVDTAQLHLAAWRRVARELDFTFDDDVAEGVKGVSREAALRVVLRAGGVELDPAELTATAARKNDYYNEQLRSLGHGALLPGAAESLRWLHEHGVPTALASASRNAPTILAATGIAPYFDAIVDGTTVTEAKPDPTVFLVAARLLGHAPQNCIVFEDAIAGVEGALRAGCEVIGVGDPSVLTAAASVVTSLEQVDWHTLFDRPESHDREAAL